MPNKMLIDATHPEETRVVVLRGHRVEEFDYESASKKQLRGNIYLAKVTRVEPSLQAAFVDYGGNRHGFLAFTEIHPDYYQIPVADRQALLEEEAKEESRARDAEAAEDDEAAAGGAVAGVAVGVPIKHSKGARAGKLALPPRRRHPKARLRAKPARSLRRPAQASPWRQPTSCTRSPSLPSGAPMSSSTTCPRLSQRSKRSRRT